MMQFAPRSWRQKRQPRTLKVMQTLPARTPMVPMAKLLVWKVRKMAQQVVSKDQ